MAKDKDADGTDGESKGLLGGKLKLVAIILPVLLVVGGGLYFFVLKGDSSGTGTSASPTSTCDPDVEDCESTGDGGDGSDGSDSTAEPTTKSTEKPGAMITLDAVTVNLSGGHFLKVGLAMQAAAGAGEELETGKAADAVITEFSNKTVDELASTEGREAAKKELLKAIKKAYEKKIYEIYYTTFVMN